MITHEELKTWLHRQLSNADKLLLVLGSLSAPCSVASIRQHALKAGLKIDDKWNPSTTLRRTHGLAINVPGGWEITDSGRQHLRNLGVGGISPAAVQVASALRDHLQTISKSEDRAFVEEAVKCFEAKLLRSAVVMSWVGAVAVLQDYVVRNCLNAFNAEAQRVNPSWKNAANADDLGRMKETDFLDRLAAISVIGKNAKERLKVQLDLRNSCGHPNSFSLGTHTVASHIEILILNVFSKFG